MRYVKLKFLLLSFETVILKLRATYSQIFKLSVPIMIGSAAQNVVALSDSVFLYHLSELDFAAIGFVGVFYLVIAGIGFGFTRGGQLMIARRMGEGRMREIGRTFYSMCYFELLMATVMFLFLTFGAEAFFRLFIHSELILQKSLEYLHYRSFGLFFSYTGVAIIALYAGVARTTFIVIDTIILTVLNLVLNYALVFGELGFPEMGIGGSALASTLAEIIAFIAFIIYILFDKKARTYRLFKIPNIDIQLVKQQLSISLPVVGQTVLALGSWFVFISLIESIGERPLAISNLIRIAYLILMIPCWGFSSGIHTLVSNVIGQKKIEEVIPLAFRTSVLSFVVTMCIAIPITVWPEVFLYPLLGSTNMSLIEESRPLFMILLGIISIYSVSTIFFNTIGGTGATDFTLKIQTVMTILYLMVVFLLVKYGNGGVEWAWAVEIFYWVVILVVSIWYLRTPRWHHYKV